MVSFLTKSGPLQGSVLGPLLFLIYVSDLPKPRHRQTSKSQFADDTALYGLLVTTYNLQQNFCVRTYKNWQSGVPKWRIKRNPEKTKVTFSRSPSRQIFGTHPKTAWREAQILSSSEISRNYFRLQIHFPETLWGNPGALQHQVLPNQTFSQ